MLLYNSILKINKKYFLPCWNLYMDLIETKSNPENYEFYDWYSLNDHPNMIQINLYKRNMNQNMDIIIKLAKQAVIDITKKYKCYLIENNQLTLDIGLIKCKECNDLIDIYGYCKC